VWPFDKPQDTILNLAIGRSWGGRQGIDDSAFPARFLIDSVGFVGQLDHEHIGRACLKLACRKGAGRARAGRPGVAPGRPRLFKGEHTVQVSIR
jgi:hypothetical protein